jgi:hypothetical protein
MWTVETSESTLGRCPHLPGRAKLGFSNVRRIQPAFPGFPSDRLRFPRLQLRGSTGFSPASLLISVTRVREPKKVVKEQTDVVGKIYSLGAAKSNGGAMGDGRPRPSQCCRQHTAESSFARPSQLETRPQTVFGRLKRMQIGQQILHLRLRHYLAEGWHHVAAGHNHLADALVIRRHSAL